MNEQEIGKSFALSKGFKWMGGMKLLNGIRVLESYLAFMYPSDTPDVNDPATFGCLLFLARNKLNNPYWYPKNQPELIEILAVLNE
jgi:hypothetical protein